MDYPELTKHIKDYFTIRWKHKFLEVFGWIGGDINSNYLIFPRYTNILYKTFLKTYNKEQLDKFIIEIILTDIFFNKFDDYAEIRFYDFNNCFRTHKNLCIWESKKAAEHFNESIYIIHFSNKEIWKIDTKYATKRNRTLPQIKTLQNKGLID